MCEYCDGSKRPMDTEEDGQGVMYVELRECRGYPALLHIRDKVSDADTFAFGIDFCPACGRRFPMAR